MAIYSAITRYLKEILLALSLLIAFPAIGRQLAEVAASGAIVGYLGRLAILWAALLAAAYIRPAPLRWITALLFALAAYCMFVFERITTQFLTYDTFITMMNSTGSAGDALAQNRTAFLGAIMPALLLCVGMGLKPRPHAPRLSTWIAAGAPWLASAGLAGILFVRGGDGAAGQPPSYAPIAYLALAGYEAATGDIGARQPVQLPRASQPRSRNIVLIIDESVAGQYLDINSANGVPTPLSRPWPGIGIHNYGLAVAITNCSASSNVTLRYGGTRADYKRIIATQPSIWAYARQAGLQTVYIDGQMRDGTLQNFMTAEERAEIGSFIQLGHLPTQERDMAIAHLLARELADPGPVHPGQQGRRAFPHSGQISRRLPAVWPGAGAQRHRYLPYRQAVGLHRLPARMGALPQQLSQHVAVERRRVLRHAAA